MPSYPANYNVSAVQQQVPATPSLARLAQQAVMSLVSTGAIPPFVGAQSYPALLGRPVGSYVSVMSAPQYGPTPHLARGVGISGAIANSNANGGASLPAYVDSQHGYQPAPMDYSPPTNEGWMRRIPKTSNLGVNGRDMVSTYEPHDFTVAEYEPRQWRSSALWEVLSYPSTWRNLLGPQLVQKYQLQQYVTQARPLAQNDYFLGYQINPALSQQLGSGGAGVRPLGY